MYIKVNNLKIMKKVIIFSFVIAVIAMVSCKGSDKEKKSNQEMESIVEEQMRQDSIDAAQSADSALIAAVREDKSTITVNDLAPAGDTSFAVRTKKFYKNDANPEEKLVAVYGIKTGNRLGVVVVQIEGEKNSYKLPQTERKENDDMVGVYTDGSVILKQKNTKVILTINNKTTAYTQIQ